MKYHTGLDMIQKLFLIVLALIVISITSAPVAEAATAPQFPSCENASGTVIAEYDTGVHGIPGKTGTYTGSDKVFVVTEDQILQCYCPDSGSQGIQSNWWKYQDISESDLKIFIKTGWVHILDGSLWGLDNSSYLVQNIPFSCSGTGGSSDSQDDSDSSSSSSSSSDNNSNGRGGTTGQVLGVTSLADTGNSLAIFSLFGLSIVALLAARK